MPLDLGKLNLLTVAAIEDGVVQLASSDDETISLRKKELKKEVNEGDEVEVFIYSDAKGEPVATLKRPFAQVGEAAYLKVKQESSIGAFLDWGIEKDLFVPFNQQKDKMKEGGVYLVFVFIDDETNRITGSSKVNSFIYNDDLELKEGDAVNILICDETDLGIKVIVENKYWGVLYRNEIFQPIKKGDKTKGFIKKVREDGKLDVTLQEQGYDETFTASLKIQKLLKDAGGFINLTDKSDPEAIYQALQMSKKTFKKAIGLLYKERKITIESNGIKQI